ncbi:ribonuclease Z [Acidimangrovimonas pyrenivorans]|uniref:MBL fold metallo-hydrolase n=1 Tax=Acidimangrovimonas pyrenivorans TaxID=2030798 RepID=A0ABV7AMH9_9RHOB
MRPSFYPALVNDRSGDPAVYVDFLRERRAILFDLGEINALPPRKILRLSDVFVSHTHVDHFIGFDRLLRLLLGRPKTLRLYGPDGFVDRVAAKLNAYTWNLVDRFADDLIFEVTELAGAGQGRRARFRLKARFAREGEEQIAVDDGVILSEPGLTVRFAELTHRTPCLAYALQETAHVNIWRNRVAELGLALGPWLRRLKQAIQAGLPDATPIAVETIAGARRDLPLGQLRDRVASVTAGQKIAYVTDAGFTPANAAAIVELARGADTLFIEAAFAGADAALARDRAHLTAAEAGELARQAGVARVEPFHFSPRYSGMEDRLLAEAIRAFRGGMRDLS